jgi:hypothetical protein
MYLQKIESIPENFSFEIREAPMSLKPFDFRIII